MAAVEALHPDSLDATEPCPTTVPLPTLDGTRPAQPVSTVVEETLKTVQPVNDDASHFECNVCLEVAQEPVVTLCGHLYCWPCLYRCVFMSEVAPVQRALCARQETNNAQHQQHSVRVAVQCGPAPFQADNPRSLHNFLQMDAGPELQQGVSSMQGRCGC